MYLGRVVELGDAGEVYADPKHPYTRALLQAIPEPDPSKRKKKELPQGEVPDAVHPPAGCRFHPRCPVALRTCGWEGQDFLDYIDRRSLDPVLEARDRLSVGREEDWEAKGLLASRKMVRGNQAGTVESVTHVMSEAPMPMSQALSRVSVVGETVQVEFQPPADLQPKKIDDRVVECLLY